MDVKALEAADDPLAHRSEIVDGLSSKKLLTFRVIKVACSPISHACNHVAAALLLTLTLLCNLIVLLRQKTPFYWKRRSAPTLERLLYSTTRVDVGVKNNLQYRNIHAPL